ncbi:MAG: hypothetical protein ACTHKL_26475 [Streptosporangiaceae bacterium]
MSFSQHLVLWLHVAFVIFTIGPVTLAIMSTPRYIRKRDIRILRYLARMTLAFGIGSLGVLIVGVVLASMLGKGAKPWIIISETLFVVTLLLLGLIHRDQRHAIKTLETAATTAASATAPAGAAADLVGSATAAELPSAPVAQAQAVPAQSVPAQSVQAQAPQAERSQGPGRAAVSDADPDGDAADAAAIAVHMANVERGRIAMMGGVVSVIWLVVLVLMVWNG